MTADYNVAMSTATLVSVDEYLRTTYEPDCDYVEGVLEERNVGTIDHSLTEVWIIGWLIKNWEGRLQGLVECRLKVAADRYRIPDVSVVRFPVQRQQVLTSPPYICIEVLSPDDTWGRLQERLDDYLSLGVPNIWVIDPTRRRGYRVTREGYLEALDGILRTSDGEVALPLADLFL